MKYGFGIDLGGTTVKLAYFDENGTMLDKWEIPTVTTDGGKQILPDIASSIRQYMDNHQISDASILGLGIGKRFPKVPIGRVNMAVTGTVLFAGMLLGSKLGFGTFFNIFGGSIVMDIVFGALHFEPRSVQHENLIQTLAALSAARQADRAARV